MIDKFGDRSIRGHPKGWAIMGSYPSSFWNLLYTLFVFILLNIGHKL